MRNDKIVTIHNRILLHVSQILVFFKRIHAYSTQIIADSHLVGHDLMLLLYLKSPSNTKKKSS